VLVFGFALLSDIPCKNYDYVFVFVKVMPKILLVPFFPDTVYVYYYYRACCMTPYNNNNRHRNVYTAVNI